MTAGDLKTYLERDGRKLEDNAIDHIIPYNAFVKWGDLDDEFFQAAYCNYRNMQLLTREENSSKGNKCTEDQFWAYIEEFANAIESSA
eukprot:jgi/Tetstr1/433532/TSEL_022800.t1